MTEDAVKRAIQSSAREAFAMGMRAAPMRGGDRERLKQNAVGYAEDLVLPMVEAFVQQALEEQWTRERAAAAAATS